MGRPIARSHPNDKYTNVAGVGHPIPVEHAVLAVTALRPLPKRAVEGAQRRRAGQSALRLDNVTLGKALAEGQVLLVEMHVVAGMAQCFQRAIVEDRIAVGEDRGHDGRGQGDVDTVELEQGLDGRFGSGAGRSGDG